MCSVQCALTRILHFTSPLIVSKPQQAHLWCSRWLLHRSFTWLLPIFVIILAFQSQFTLFLQPSPFAIPLIHPNTWFWLQAPRRECFLWGMSCRQGVLQYMRQVSAIWNNAYFHFWPHWECRHTYLLLRQFHLMRAVGRRAKEKVPLQSLPCPTATVFHASALHEICCFRCSWSIWAQRC